MRIAVDKSKCQGVGICEGIAPTVFEVLDNGELQLNQSSPPIEMAVKVQAAVDQCPTGALSSLESA